MRRDDDKGDGSSFKGTSELVRAKEDVLVVLILLVPLFHILETLLIGIRIGECEFDVGDEFVKHEVKL